MLFGTNTEGGVDAVAGLTSRLRAEGADVLVAIDEEGGDVTRLEASSGSSYPGALALGAVDDVELTRAVAGAIAGDVAAAGIDLNLAPVADVNTNPDNPVIGVRSFGDDPALVARHVAAFVEGTQQHGVAACAKHFPGHGDTSVDSHLGLPTVDELDAGALLPFRSAVDAGVRAVMTAHIVVSALDTAPATLSGAVIGGVLREELGFDGLVVTDALDMAAVAETVGLEESGVRAIAAGADALCLGPVPGPDDVERLHRAILAAVTEGRLPESRLAGAAERLRRTATWTRPEHTAVDRSVGERAARRAVAAEGDVRLPAAPLVVELAGAASIAAGPPAYTFGDAVRQRWPDAAVARSEASVADDDRPLVVVLRDAARDQAQQGAARRLLRERPAAVLVETGLPGWRPPEPHAWIATHGMARVNLDAAVSLLVGA